MSVVSDDISYLSKMKIFAEKDHDVDIFNTVCCDHGLKLT